MAYSKLRVAIAKMFFGAGTRLDLYRSLGSFIEAGLPIHDVLKELADEYEKGKDRRAVAIRTWMDAMDSGAYFSESLEGWAPSSEIAILRAGEESGDLKVAFESAINNTEQIRAMKRAVRGSLGMPAMLLTVGLAVLLAISFFVLPTLMELAPPETWPQMSRSFYDFSIFVQTQGLLVLICLIALTIGITFTLGRLTGPIRQFLDKIPPWSTYKTMQSSSFLMAIASMMNNGRPFNEALEEIQKTANPYMRWHILRMNTRLEAGMTIGEAMDTGLFSKQTGISVRVYGRLSEIHREMGRIGKESIEYTVQSISSAMSFVEKLTMLVVFGYIIWVYLSVMSITDSVQSSIQM